MYQSMPINTLMKQEITSHSNMLKVSGVCDSANFSIYTYIYLCTYLCILTLNTNTLMKQVILKHKNVLKLSGVSAIYLTFAYIHIFTYIPVYAY